MDKSSFSDLDVKELLGWVSVVRCEEAGKLENSVPKGRRRCETCAMYIPSFLSLFRQYVRRGLEDAGTKRAHLLQRAGMANVL